MKFFIVAQTGPQQGQRFDIAPGMKIGRAGADIILDDVRVSNLHARIEDRDGDLVVIDQGSKNGLRLDGRRVPEVLIREDQIFQIGSFEFLVISNDQTKVTGSGTAAVLPLFQQPVKTPLEETLEGLIVLEAKNNIRSLALFDPQLKLTFLRGLQISQSFLLGYGPRHCGSQSLDLQLYEPTAPALCFEILPTPRGATLKTSHSDLVKVNGFSAATHLLKPKDLISVVDSVIEVDFI